MAEQIKDGTGSSRLAGVNAENRLMISGPTVSKEHHTNFTFQDSYNMLFDVTPVGASDVFLYLKNGFFKERSRFMGKDYKRYRRYFKNIHDSF